MAVQKSRKTRSKRGMRRAHDSLNHVPALSYDSETGELHRRHHVTAEGFYRGREIVPPKAKANSDHDHDHGHAAAG